MKLALLPLAAALLAGCTATPLKERSVGLPPAVANGDRPGEYNAKVQAAIAAAMPGRVVNQGGSTFKEVRPQEMNSRFAADYIRLSQMIYQGWSSYCAATKGKMSESPPEPAAWSRDDVLAFVRNYPGSSARCDFPTGDTVAYKLSINANEIIGGSVAYKFQAVTAAEKALAEKRRMY